MGITQELVTLSGRVGRVFFQDDKTGYCAFRLDAQNDSYGARGVLPDLREGMTVNLQGVWKTHARFGTQLEVKRYEIPRAVDREGTIGYLVCLPGIGPTIANRIVDKFGVGDQVFGMLDKNPDQLLQISGISRTLLSGIVEENAKLNGSMRNLMGWLADHGVSTSYATKIFNAYGSGAVSVLKKNPYLLAIDIRGIGFKTADEIAMRIGIKPDSEFRCQAAIIHVLREGSGSGHCFLPSDELLTKTCEFLQTPMFRPLSQAVARAVSVLDGKKVVVEGDRVYLHWLFSAEDNLAYSISQLAGEFSSGGATDSWLATYQTENNITLSEGQKQAVKVATRHGLTIVTGGPGVGKTTVARAIVHYWNTEGRRIMGLAPTGKAAQRLKETATEGCKLTGTIHRVLGWDGEGFQHHSENPLEADCFLVDESSMLDVSLADKLFQAIPSHGSVVLIGDPDQLPSVGPGNVVRDLINSGVVPVVHLTEIFRQAANSRIIRAAHSINHGDFPDLELLDLDADIWPNSDALWLNCPQVEIPCQIQQLLSRLVEHKKDVQILSPQHQGGSGNIALNRVAQTFFNPDTGGDSYGDFRVGDRVIQLINNYELGIFNGDIGVIERIDVALKSASIVFPDSQGGARAVQYPLQKFLDLSLAYSISVHKSQGSEFQIVIIPVTTQHYMLLQRNLLYTGVTRGKKLVILVGESKAIRMAVGRNEIGKRNTYLKERLSR